MTQQPINTAIIGASGYTGAELVRLVDQHDYFAIHTLIAESNAGKTMQELYPHFNHSGLPQLISFDQADWSSIELVFSCLPHGTSQPLIASLPEHLRVIDLSADFRIEDPKIYEAWYNTPHQAQHLQKQAVYGLTELNSDAIKQARLVACPGCYPTSALLPLYPLLSEQLIDASVIIDAKSGVSGAGRSAKTSLLFGEIANNMSAYNVDKHRHMAEMEQFLGKANQEVDLHFTPHLIPTQRGILSTIYVRATSSVDKLYQKLEEQYHDAAFVHLLPKDQMPNLRHVAGSNHCHIGLTHVKGEHVVIVSVIDNLIKGASGQAVQNANLLFNLDETAGLTQLPVFP